MSSSLKALFDQAIQPESPYLKLLQERGLVRRDLSVDDLRSEPVRGDAVEQALILFAADTEREERQEILAQLQAPRPEGGMEVAAFKGFEHTATPEAVFRKLEMKAESIWEKAVAATRENARLVSVAVGAAATAITEKSYDKAAQLLESAASDQAKIETQFQTAYSEARRGLRREYNAEFQSRVWNEPATRHFDTLVNRSVFVPPEEMRQSAHQLAETKQRLISEKSYSTELEKRVQARPERNPGQGFRP